LKKSLVSFVSDVCATLKKSSEFDLERCKSLIGSLSHEELGASDGDAFVLGELDSAEQQLQLESSQ